MSIKHIIDTEIKDLNLDLIIEGLNEIISNGSFTTVLSENDEITENLTEDGDVVCNIVNDELNADNCTLEENNELSVDTALNENLITLYRGINGYNVGNNYYSPSKEFAIEFTRSGRESELRKIKIDTNKIYKHEPLPKGYGGDDPNFDLAIKTAQKQGYIAMWVDEGYDQPNSVFIINPNEKINEDNNIINDNIALSENVYKVYHGTNQKFSKFNFKNATQGIVWFTDSPESIEKGEHGGAGNNIIMTRYITINKPAGWAEYEKYGLGQLRGLGYDGVILPQDNKTDYFVFSPKSISAKDNSGTNNSENDTNENMSKSLKNTHDRTVKFTKDIDLS